jgi:hypothetical protein
MKANTKRDCLNQYFDLMTKGDKLHARVIALMESNRITSGACFYVHNPYDWHGAKSIAKILEKAGHSKNYTAALKRISQWHWNYYLKDIEAHLAETTAFVNEQEKLPFDKTQKQILIQKGELK